MLRSDSIFLIYVDEICHSILELRPAGGKACLRDIACGQRLGGYHIEIRVVGTHILTLGVDTLEVGIDSADYITIIGRGFETGKGMATGTGYSHRGHGHWREALAEVDFVREAAARSPVCSKAGGCDIGGGQRGHGVYHRTAALDTEINNAAILVDVGQRHIDCRVGPCRPLGYACHAVRTGIWVAGIRLVAGHTVGFHYVDALMIGIVVRHVFSPCLFVVVYVPYQHTVTRQICVPAYILAVFEDKEFVVGNSLDNQSLV